ncbi:MAG: hypothetical protein EOO90_11320 [Pedobacter sp.]|nr:MAG: hypothetical protein EOO90_11320 [Pedobacter sp.]
MRTIRYFLIILGYVSILEGLLASTTCRSQVPYTEPVKELNVAEGLPQSVITGLAQDKTGFIWIATRDGLARYDGRNFKIFKRFPFSKNTLSGNIIKSIFLSSTNQLWILFEKGDIDILDIENEHIINLTQLPKFKVLKTIDLNENLREDQKGNVWLQKQSGGIILCNPKNNRLHDFTSELAEIVDKPLVVSSKKYTLVVADRKQVFGITQVNKKLVKQLLYKITDTLSEKYFFSSPKDNLMMVDRGKMYCLDPVRKKMVTAEDPKFSSEIKQFSEEGSNAYFLCRNGEILSFNLDGEWKVWRKMESSGVRVKFTLLDKSGILWAGYSTGVKMFERRLKRLPWEIYKPGSFIYNILSNYGVPEKEMADFKSNSSYDFKSYRDRLGITWFVHHGNGFTENITLNYFSKGKLYKPNWKYDRSKIKDLKYADAVTSSPKGKIWTLNRQTIPIEYDTVKHEALVHKALSSPILSSFAAVVMDREDNFWIATEDQGLYQIDKRRKIRYQQGSSKGSLPVNNLTSIIQDPVETNILWLGSIGGGLVKFNQATGISEIFTTADGLPDNTVYAIILDKKKDLIWCSSNRGIFSFNLHVKRVKSYTGTHGLQSEEFNRFSYFSGANGNIAFGGIGGYTFFHPDSLVRDSFQPNIAITELLVNQSPWDYGKENSQLSKAINAIDTLLLSHTQNFLDFRFAALQFNFPEKLRYRYCLKGFSNGWIFNQFENKATFTNVPPGNYILQINAANTDGIWSPHVKELNIIISPPFWKKWWFYSLLIIGSIFIVWLYIHRRTRFIRKEEQQKLAFEKKALELEAQALRAQMNPHFIFNCLNSMKMLIQENERDKAVDYLVKFSKLIRSQLNNTGKLISLDQELKMCRLYCDLEALRFGKDIDYQFEIDPKIDVHTFLILPLLLQPFIENAIWHGILPKKKKGKIQICVTAENNNVICTIEDDGIGRRESQRRKSSSKDHQSRGIQLTQYRLDIHRLINHQGGSIEIFDKEDETGNETGTIVKIILSHE